jgi:hypothetical protein
VLRRIFGPKRDEVTGGWRKREEHNLGVFENRVLGRIFGPKRDEVKGGRREREEHRLGVFENSAEENIPTKEGLSDGLVENKGGTLAGGVWEQGAEEDIRTKEG